MFLCLQLVLVVYLYIEKKNVGITHLKIWNILDSFSFDIYCFEFRKVVLA